MILRDYQQNAFDAAKDWLRTSIEPCLIDAATGAGKSHIIAAVAEWLHDISKGKRVLCLAPSAELVTQNREKYLATGNPASVFSASAGGTCLRHPVVFGTPGTVKNRITRFGPKFCAVVVDECHGMTPTVQAIIDAMRGQNPNLRVLGLTATPYRMGSGYVFRIDENGRPMGDQSCRDPYFTKRVYRIGAHELIEKGYLTPPTIGRIETDNYHTLDMQLNGQGKFVKQDIDQAYHGHGRKTAAIIADVVRQSQGRDGVMIFAATVQHAHECMASLPPRLSAIVTGTTPRGERAKIIEKFKAREIKYIVNVSVLTTGFDAPHVSVIALLRATESAGLLQQIVGRGLRLDDGKDDCLILDYAENLERHCPDGDIFNPDIKVSFKGEESAPVEARCPQCSVANTFSARKNDEGFDVDEYGYFVDLAGMPVMTPSGPMPAHYGRRCQGMRPAGGGRLEQCSYRWTQKHCPHCEAENDIASRYCGDCRGELVDPNEKLRLEFRAMKRDPTRIQCDNIVRMVVTPTVARSGRECLKVDYETEYRKFSVWYVKGVRGTAERRLSAFMAATNDGQETPCTVTYKKDPDSGFYETLAFNHPADVAPQQQDNGPLQYNSPLQGTAQQQDANK